MSSTYKAADSRREEFRKYLEKSGVIDALTKVLVGLYEEPEKPSNALEFVMQHVNSAGPDSPDVEAMKIELAELKVKHEQLKQENEDLKTRLDHFDTPQPTE